jgi:LmbE family N-acetylglucosaminyl deacetylase
MNPDAASERAPLPRPLSRPARGKVLLLAPHADDDVLGAGGTCALHVEQGDPVRVMVVYDGLEGDPERRFGREELRERRRREARAGGAHLGLTDYEFLDYPEGHMPTPGELLEAGRRMAEILRRVGADTIYAPWVGEHHLDHHVLARVTRLGLAIAGFHGAAWGYEVWTPSCRRWSSTSRPFTRRRSRRCASMQSQLAYLDILHKGMALGAQRAVPDARGALRGGLRAPGRALGQRSRAPGAGRLRADRPPWGPDSGRSGSARFPGLDSRLVGVVTPRDPMTATAGSCAPSEPYRGCRVVTP